jgi:lipoprotein-anchoring transpeptidase ErfK/SrfK
MKNFFIIILIGLISYSLSSIVTRNLGAFLLARELSSDTIARQILNQNPNPEGSADKAWFNGEPVDYRAIENTITQYIRPLAAEYSQPDYNILGVNDQWIEINLSQQRLNAWEGGSLVYSYLVSTGLWGRTPVGDYQIYVKYPATLMTGGSTALGTYYYLPNVPCTMYFYKGYGIHGTYWHNNFGHPMSHGCVNMRTEEACVLYNWASVGTRVNIHY